MGLGKWQAFGKCERAKSQRRKKEQERNEYLNSYPSVVDKHTRREEV